MRFLWLVLLGLLTSCASSNPLVTPPLQDPLLPEPGPGTPIVHRLYAYGDTRTGVFLFENQLNVGEGVHDWVVQQMLAHGKPEAVLFMGDAVYAGGATFHYDNFVQIINRFRDNDIPFLPSLGNHELLAGILGVISPWWDSKDPTSNDAGEQQFRQHILDKHTVDTTDPTRVDKVNKDAQHLNDHLLPRLEEKAASRPVAERLEAGTRVINELYLKRAQLGYLERFYTDSTGIRRTWWAASSPIGHPTLKVVSLDTNNLAYQPQIDWFKKTMDTASEDLIIVMGHHPPDTIDGWDPYMPYLTHKKAVLWLFSHVHAFEYAFLNGEQPDKLTRAEFITGGGGAPPDVNSESSYPIKGWTSGPPGLVAGHLFHYLDIQISKDFIYVTVMGCARKGEPMTPRATYTIKMP